MGRVEENGWFYSDNGAIPEDGGMYTILLKNESEVDLHICQYRDGFYHKGEGFFVECDSGARFDWCLIDRWKPFKLPSDIVERLATGYYAKIWR